MYQTKRYQCHIPLTETLDELQLAIKKQNENLDLQLNKIKKEFLFSINYNSKLTKSQNIDLATLIEIYLNSTPTKQNMPSNLTTLPNFSNFYQQISELISIKNANLFLENYILKLQAEESIALKIKKYYEKNAKKSLPKKRLLKK